ncbi:MAG: hypothetical protein ABI811_04270 [Acidobacteriota bacterium]
MPFVTDWSPDGKYLLFSATTPKASSDILYVPLDNSAKPVELAHSEFMEAEARFSPDGKWISFTSNESGTPEIYVQAFPSGANKQRVSTSVGMEANWARNKKELFYETRTAGSELWSVPIDLSTGFRQTGPPKELFTVRQFAWAPNNSRFTRAESPDGQRFLYIAPEAGASEMTIHIVQNWEKLLEQRK